MAVLKPWLRAKYLADLARVQKQIATLEPVIDSALANSEVEEYSFDSGEGRQRATRRSIKELMGQLEALESREARILRKLYGTAIVNMNLRRKQYSNHRGNYGPY